MEHVELEIDAEVALIRKTIRTTNTNCRQYVQSKSPFITGNIFAEWHNGRYSVFSYGTHFPMYIYDSETGHWYGNKDKYSITTSKHQSQARPYDVDIQWFNSDTMRGIVVWGIAEIVAHRLAA